MNSILLITFSNVCHLGGTSGLSKRELLAFETVSTPKQSRLCHQSPEPPYSDILTDQCKPDDPDHSVCRCCCYLCKQNVCTGNFTSTAFSLLLSSPILLFLVLTLSLHFYKIFINTSGDKDTQRIVHTDVYRINRMF